jgi:hypothetical protein
VTLTQPGGNLAIQLDEVRQNVEIERGRFGKPL